MSRRIRVAVAVLSILGMILFYVLDPAQYVFMPRCVFKWMTGLNCPGCGLQRGIHALLHGRLHEGLCYNLYLMLVIPYAVLCIGQFILPAGRWRESMGMVLTNRYTIGFLIVTFVLWGFVRNLLGV